MSYNGDICVYTYIEETHYKSYIMVIAQRVDNGRQLLIRPLSPLEKRVPSADGG